MGRRLRLPGRLGVLIPLVGLPIAGCSGPGSAATLTVLAASSLTEAFADLAGAFERAHPGVEVVIGSAGSQALRVQVELGARADVFASANWEHMEGLIAGGHVVASTVLTTNALVIVVPAGNPLGLTGFADLDLAERIVLAADGVPVGEYGRRFLESAEREVGNHFRRRVEERVVSLEPNVRLVLAKVELGEADAAIVYRSDVTSSRRVHVIPIPERLNERAEYYIGALAAAPEAYWADRWVDFVTSPGAMSVFERHGFRTGR